MILVLLSGMLSFAVTALATPFAIKLAYYFGLVDDPSKRPHPAHIQDRIIPRAGGIPIYLGIVVGILVFLPLEKYLLGIIVGMSVLLGMGLRDDKVVRFSPYLRLVILFLAAVIAVGSGIGISYLTNPFHSLSFLPQFFTSPIIRLDGWVITIPLLGVHKLIIVADLLALFWIVALTQVINWSKGVDGQMPGITLMAALTLGLLAFKFYTLGDPTQLNVAKLAFIVAGASLGLLIFNWHPAKIIPGFSASTILAYLLAILAILSTAKLATALLVLAVPTVDFIYTFWRRIFSGRSPVWGDRGHLHHRLLDDLGWSHQKISLFYILGSAMLGAASLVLDTGSKLFGIIAIGTVFVVFILWLNSFGGLSKRPDQDNG